MRFLGRLARIWLLVAFVVIVVYSAIYHQDRVGVSMPPWIEHITVPGYMIFLTFFFAGVLTVSVFFWIEGLRRSIEIRRLNKRLRELGADEPHERDRAPVTAVSLPREPTP